MFNQFEWQKQVQRLIFAKQKLETHPMAQVKFKELEREWAFLNQTIQQFLVCLNSFIEQWTVESVTPMSIGTQIPLATFESVFITIAEAITGLGWGIDFQTSDKISGIEKIQRDYPTICRALILYEALLYQTDRLAANTGCYSLREMEQKMSSIEREIMQAEQLLNSYEKTNAQMLQRQEAFRVEGSESSAALMSELVDGINGCIKRTTEQKTELLRQFKDYSEKVAEYFDCKADLSSWRRLIQSCLQSLKEHQPISYDEAIVIQTEWEKQLFFKQYHLLNHDQRTFFWQQREQLIADGWDEAALDYYFQEIAQKQKLEEVVEQWQQVRQIGSNWYTQMYQKSRKSAREKIELVFSQMGVVMENGVLQLLGEMTFDPLMPPHSPFLKEWAQTVQQAYEGENLSDIRVHQFRMYLDRHNLSYIRAHFRLGEMTDEDALKVYTYAPEPQGLAGKKMLAERARLHNKQLKTMNYRRGKENRKRLTPDFHSEFILDYKGNFVSQWNVLDIDATGRVRMDEAYYRSKYPSVKEKLFFEQQIVNGESFNYANKNDELHRKLDVRPSAKYDPPLRKSIVRRWHSPENRKQYKWRTADRAKDGYSKKCL